MARYRYIAFLCVAILGIVSYIYMYAVKSFYLPVIEINNKILKNDVPIKVSKELNTESKPNITIATLKHTATTDGNCQQTIRNSKSEWFQSKFKEINPFWTRSNIELDPETLKWWLGIQRSKAENLTEILNNAFNIGIPSEVTTYTKTPHCKTCAVIGNSYILKDSKHGEEIDANDIIIRMNKAKVSGFEKDVGKKTTYRIAYPESAIPSYDLDGGVLLLDFKPLDVKWFTSALTTGEIKRTYINVLNKINCNVTNSRITHPTFFRYCYTDWVEKHGRYPSTGIFGVLFALQVCDQINVFGFGADADGGWTHYWEKPKSVDKAFRKTNVHSGDFERDLLIKLEDEGIIKRYK